MQSTSTQVLGQREPAEKVQEWSLDGPQNQTPDPGITGVTSSRGGVDWLEISGWVHWSSEVFEALYDQLEVAKEQARQNSELRISDPVRVELAGGEIVEVLPHTIGRGIKCRFGLRWMGITIGLTGRREAGDSQPNVRITATSDALMVRGHVAIWESVVGLLQSMGGDIVRTNVSRIDVCADLTVNTDRFVEQFQNDQYIARAKSFAAYKTGRRVNGLEVGKGVKLRIYDKLLEAANKSDKLDIMVQRRWGGTIPEDGATRVEFQLRSQHLKEHIVDSPTVEAVFAALPKICEWCTESWFRMTDSKVDYANKNHQRAGLSDLWKDTIAAFQSWAGESTESLIKPVKRSSDNTKRVIQQAMGCLAKAIAKTKDTGLGSVGFLAAAMRILEEHCEYGAEAMVRKRAELDFGTALGSAVDLRAVPF